MQRSRIAVAALVGALARTIVLAQEPWQPPVGIPAPSFGVAESAGAVTVIVGEGHALPNPVPAGAVVEIRGTYTRNHQDRDQIRCAGTAGRPAFIRGAPGAVVTGAWEITGSYCIVEQLKFQGPWQTVLAPADHVVLRDVEVTGTKDSGGLGVQCWSDATASDVVLLRVNVHGNGDVTHDGDRDLHGVGVYLSSESTGTIHHLWLLDSELAYNEGDGIQINAGTNRNERIHHVYVGRTSAHHNKQVGFGLKQATDVVFSQNTAYAHRPSSSAPGGCFGFLYAPERVWVIDNEMYDCTYGVYWGSDSGQGTGRDSYFVGNRIHDLQDFGSFYAKDDSAWGPAGFMFSGGVNRYLARNTLVNMPLGYGVNVPYAQGKVFGYENAGANFWHEQDAPRDLCGDGTLRIGDRHAPTSRLPDCSIAQLSAEAAIAATFESLYGLRLPLDPPATH